MEVRRISDYKWNDEKKGNISGLHVSSAFPNMNIKQPLVKELSARAACGYFHPCFSSMAIVPTQKVQRLERMLRFLPFPITAGRSCPHKHNRPRNMPCEPSHPEAPHAAIGEPEFKR